MMLIIAELMKVNQLLNNLVVHQRLAVLLIVDHMKMVVEVIYSVVDVYQDILVLVINAVKIAVGFVLGILIVVVLDVEISYV
jgi:hypothetical protein